MTYPWPSLKLYRIGHMTRLASVTIYEQNSIRLLEILLICMDYYFVLSRSNSVEQLINLFSIDLIPFARIINPFSRDLISFARIIIPFSRDLIPFARIINPF